MGTTSVYRWLVHGHHMMFDMSAPSRLRRKKQQIRHPSVFTKRYQDALRDRSLHHLIIRRGVIPKLQSTLRYCLNLHESVFAKPRNFARRYEALQAKSAASRFTWRCLSLLAFARVCSKGVGEQPADKGPDRGSAHRGGQGCVGYFLHSYQCTLAPEKVHASRPLQERIGVPTYGYMGAGLSLLILFMVLFSFWSRIFECS